jgi:hypothetical protein
MTASTLDRIAVRSRLVDSGCILWDGTRVSSGYGQISIANRMRRVHRVVWELNRGPIPPGMSVCHRCDNPPCINLGHLFLGSHLDNMKDRDAKGRHGNQRKTHCPRGHEYVGANLYRSPRGERFCRSCKRHLHAES